jgi:hypothetical protein
MREASEPLFKAFVGPLPEALRRHGFWKGRSMGLLVLVLVTVVAVLGMVLFAVHKIRPRSLRFKAHVTRWLSLSLEIDSPQRETRGRR